MSSAVIPDDNLEPDFLSSLDNQNSPSTSSNSASDVNSDERKYTQVAAGRKLLRDSVFKGADLNLRRKAIIANIAKTKYSQYSDQRSLKMAATEYNQMVLTSFARLRSQMPDLDAAQVRLLAEQDVLKLQGSLKSSAQALASQGGKLAKKGLEKAITAGGNLALPGLGTVLHFFIFTKLGRILILLLCLCCSYLAIDVWQTFASEDKWRTITESANLINCAGGTEEAKIAECLVEQKIEEYSQSPEPE